MPIHLTTQLRDRSTKVLLAVSIPVLVAVTGFLGVIALSMIPPSPKAELFELGQQVEQTRASALQPAQAEALERAATTLEAARRSIKAESEKSWTLRSYDRARSLLWRAEGFLQEAQQGSTQRRDDQAVPAG